MTLHLRDQEMSLHDIASRLVITRGKKKGGHPHPRPPCGCRASGKQTA